jgi:4-diphosphocytidyl-2-C-methyl-D-erythritol kinase
MAPAPLLHAGTDVDLAAEIDDDAEARYGEHGVSFDHAADHPFVVAELAWWRAAAAAGRLVFAADAAAPGTALGFCAYGFLDGEPYLDQLSVRHAAQHRGLGRALLAHALAWAATDPARCLWLTTYAPRPFNRPFYEAQGVTVVAPPHRPELAATLAEQRRHLPFPDQRLAMRAGLRPR